MVAFNFQFQFAADVANRIKKQTIRQTRRGKVGDHVQLYTGQRTPNCIKLVEEDPVLVCVDYIAIRPDYLTVGDVNKHPRDRDEFARLDGFKDYEDMRMWFEQRYGSPTFVGYLHRWDWEDGK
ncbi:MULTISPECIES: ASCH domain-containing protein [unclassified Sinorhizobium]|uniref:ASCH domain-containing protein n=1 Tax=unclassified Sinorhizobium TaxID=2613772 RepID=UPI0035257DFC